MRLRELRFEDPEVQIMFRALVSTLSNISTDNMKITEIAGVTDASGDTAKQFRHDLGELPSFWLPLEGRIYIPRRGVSENQIDIRSSEISEEFRILLVR